MNMMVNTSELVANEAETNKLLKGTALKSAVSKLVASWEKKQANKALKIGGLGFMAISLAACNSSSDDTATSTPSTPSTPATPAAPATNSITIAATPLNVFGTDANDTVTATGVTLTSNHILADAKTDDADVLNITTVDDYALTPTVVGIETVNFILNSVSATGSVADAVFDAAATNMAATTYNMSVSKVGSPVTSGKITGLKTGATVAFDSTISTAASTDSADNGTITATSSADLITLRSGGDADAARLTTVSATGTDSAAAADTSFDTDSDGSVTLTTTGGDMTIDAVAATTVVATSAGDINANANALTAATSVNLTSAHEMLVDLDAATTATLSAGGTTASTIVDAGATAALSTLTSLTLSGNGSAHIFDVVGAEGLSSVTMTGSQNVTVRASAADIDGLTSNKLTVVDNTADAASANITTAVELNTAAGDVDLTAAAVDVIKINVDNNAKTATVASGATVQFMLSQTATTIDGPDAGAATNSVTVNFNDELITENVAEDIATSLTFTDFKTATINVDQDSTSVAGATYDSTLITALTASADNTNVTINAGANGVQMAGTNTTGTGALTINSNAAVALGTSLITASAITTTGTGAVSWTTADSNKATTVTTGSGADAVTFNNGGGTALGDSLTLNTGAGNDTITLSDSTAASKVYSINGGDGVDKLIVGANTLDFNNGTSFTMTGVETLDFADNTTAATVGAALFNGAGLILTHTDKSDTINVTIELGSVTSLDMTGLSVDANKLTTADSLIVSAAASTSALTISGANGIKNDLTTGSGGDILTGGTGDDTISAGGGADIISGGDGADILTGAAGNDTITGGKGADTINGGAGADTLTGGAGADIYQFNGDAASGETIVETAEAGVVDVIAVVTTTDFSAMADSSFDEVEEIFVNSGGAQDTTATFTAAQLTGETLALRGAGNGEHVVINMAYGATGTFSGITEQGTTFTDPTTDTITINGLGGAETITGTGMGDIINGNAGADTLSGDAGADTINGGSGADIINGGAGNDTITGGTEIDTMTGGANDDTFALTDTGSVDVIADFTSADDTLSLLLATFAVEAGAGVVNGTNEYVEITGAAGDLTAGTNTANDVIVLTHATGFAGAAEVATSIDGKAMGDVVVVFFDSATSKTSMLYDADGNAGGAGTIFATFSNIAAADIAASFASTDFLVV